MPDVRLIQEAVRFLAEQCDHAVTIDNKGFNKMDAGFGKDLAKRERWTKRQAEAALKMIKKYQKQLKIGEIDVEKLFDGSEVTYPHLQPVNGEGPPKLQKTTTPKRTVKVKDGKMEIRFPYSNDLLNIIRSIPGRRFNNVEKFWTAPISPDGVEKLQKAGFEIDPTLEEYLKQVKARRVQVEDLPELEVPGLKRELFPFQKQGVAFIESRGGRALIGDEMGLGKTIQALAWLQLHPEKRPAVIVVPAHLKLNWAKEAEATLTKNARVQILSGTRPYSITGDIIVINYDILNQWRDKLAALNPKVLIYDEAHHIKNSSAIRTKAAKKLAKGIPHIIMLSGTPIVNRPVEGFNILSMIDPGLFPNFWEFAHKYCGAHHNGWGWDFSGATNKGELHQILTKTIMIRRLKSNVLKDLPDKLYSYIPVELSNRQEYEAAERDFIRYLKQIKGDEAAEKAKQAEHLVRIESQKQLAVKGKLKQAIDWIRNFIESGNGDSKLVVFAVHKMVIDALMKELKGIAVKVDGSCSAEERNRAVEAFQNDPAVKLFVGNIRAAGTGLTLTAASSVAFLELPWTPGELVQAEDRCHRIGQKNTVNVYYLLAEGTIEEKIAESLDDKRKVLDAVLDGKVTEETSLLSTLIKHYENQDGGEVDGQ